MENKHWNKPYSKRLYDLIQGNIDKVNYINHLYEKQERLKTNYSKENDNENIHVRKTPRQ